MTIISDGNYRCPHCVKKLFESAPAEERGRLRWYREHELELSKIMNLSLKRYFYHLHHECPNRAKAAMTDREIEVAQKIARAKYHHHHHHKTKVSNTTSKRTTTTTTTTVKKAATTTTAASAAAEVI